MDYYHENHNCLLITPFVSLWMDKDRSLWEDTRGGGPSLLHCKRWRTKRKVDVRKEFKKGAKKKKKKKKACTPQKAWVGTLSGNSAL